MISPRGENGLRKEREFKTEPWGDSRVLGPDIEKIAKRIE